MREEISLLEISSDCVCVCVFSTSHFNPVIVT